jgi:hypothetical protein
MIARSSGDLFLWPLHQVTALADGISVLYAFRHTETQTTIKMRLPRLQGTASWNPSHILLFSHRVASCVKCFRTSCPSLLDSLCC